MKTEIFIKKGWRLIASYNNLITMSKGDIVEHEGIEYKVDCCLLELDKNKMLILLES